MRKLVFEIAMLALVVIGCNSSPKKNDQKILTNLDQQGSNKNPIPKFIRINAKPDSIAIDVSRTAVLVVDMENDFCSKGGIMDHGGNNIASMMRKTISPIVEVLRTARRAGIQIIYLKMAWRQDLSDFGDEGSVNRVRGLLFAPIGSPVKAPDGSINHVLILDNWGTQVIPELKPQIGDIEIYKSRFSGFYQTNLDSTLKHLEKKYLIVVGNTTSVCVESTVRDAMFRDYSALVLEDCASEPDGSDFSRTNHDASLFIIQSEFGWVSKSEELIKAFKVQTGSDIGTLK